MSSVPLLTSGADFFAPAPTSGEATGRAELDGQVTVPLETARRLTCDSAVVRIGWGARSKILDVGRTTARRCEPGAPPA